MHGLPPYPANQLMYNDICIIMKRIKWNCGLNCVGIIHKFWMNAIWSMTPLYDPNDAMTRRKSFSYHDQTETVMFTSEVCILMNIII